MRRSNSQFLFGTVTNVFICTTLFFSSSLLLLLALGMTGIVGISVGGVVVFFLLIFLVLTIVICCIKARSKTLSTMPLGPESPSTKKKTPTTPVHELHSEESSSPGSERHNMVTMESEAAGSPLP